MPPISARSAVAAFGRQAAEGSGLTDPKFEIPMGDGGIQPRREAEETPWTAETRDVVADYVSIVNGDFSMDLPALPVSSAALFSSVLGSLSTGGAGPYTHTGTTSEALAWYSWFFAIGSQYLKLVDAKTNVVEWSARAGQPLALAVSGLGKTPTRNQPATKWSQTGTVVEAAEPFFTMIGSTIKLDATTTPASTTVRNVQGVTGVINNNLSGVQTDGAGYQYIVEGKRELSLRAEDVVLEDWNFVNQVFFGSTTGTAVSTQPIYGSAEFTFLGSDQAVAATRSLKISYPRVEWNIAEHPGANPSGDPVTYNLEGKPVKPTSGSIVTATIINANAGANY